MSYNYDDDEYGIIGTPFPALEADEIVSRKPEIDQTVRDERGRRRFHGAFTGGFSAGYWNTVGSAEGFTPKIFSSSRKDKFDKSGFISKPEDFMDEEDFGAFGIAPKRIHTKDDFVENLTMTSLKDSKMTFDEVIRSVLQPSKESIGKRLFRKMKTSAKLEEKNTIDDREEESTIQYEPKTNRHGLGYKGMLNSGDLFTEPNKKSDSKNAVTATMKSGRRLKISGEAFGYGALEDADAIDIYSTDDLSQYDFEIGSVSKKTPNKKAFQSSQNATQLDGFIKHKENFNLFVDIKQKYKPPEIPEGWKPKRISKSTGKKKSRWDNETKKIDSKSNTELNESKSKPPQKVMNANLRAVILGESVVHKIGVAKYKIEDKTEANKLEFDKEINKSNISVTTPISIPKTPLSGYFASKFTRSSTSQHEQDSLTAGLNTFENLSSTTNFFEKKKESEKNSEVQDILPVRSVYEWHPHKILCKRFGVQNPFPHLTDIVGIICLGQNDKSRNMTARLTLNQNKSSSVNIFEGLNLSSSVLLNPTQSDLNKFEVNQDVEKVPEPKLLNKDKMITSNDDSENQIEEKPKPPIDFFKSIFASDEEDEEEEEEKELENENHLQQQKEPSSAKTTSIEKKVKDFGIFSGIDFDQLQETFDPRLNSVDSSQTKDDKISNDDDDDDEECYGPALPPTMPTISPSIYSSYSESKSKHKKSKKSKSKGKKSSKKHSKHSSKKKKRKHSPTDSSSNSSDEDNEENVEDKIIELIKKVKHR